MTFSLMQCLLFSGVIRTALGQGDMDREQREHYQVVIEAKDMAGQRGGLTGTTVVNISLSDVNDNPPRFTQSKTTAPQKEDRLHGNDVTLSHTHTGALIMEFRSRKKSKITVLFLFC